MGHTGQDFLNVEDDKCTKMARPEDPSRHPRGRRGRPPEPPPPPSSAAGVGTLPRQWPPRSSMSGSARSGRVRH